MTARFHKNEFTITTTLVRRLIATQFPQLASLPVTALAESGSTNKLFRLGEDYLVRLPRQAGGSHGLAKEHRWLPYVGPGVSAKVPNILWMGEATPSFPEPWCIVGWLPGGRARSCTQSTGSRARGAGEQLQLAQDLAQFVCELRAMSVPATAVTDPSLRWYRGRPLQEYDEDMQRCLAACRNNTELQVDLSLAEQVWQAAIAIPGPAERQHPVWYHSDLVAENLLLGERGLSAVLDFGGLAVGDPTIDLHGAWELFDAGSRAVFRERVGASEAEWLRGRAWAIGIALGACAYYWKTMPHRCNDRLVMLGAALEDARVNGY